MEQIWSETLPALEEQKQKGIISHYGLSGRPLNVIDYVGKKYGFDKWQNIVLLLIYFVKDLKMLT